MIVETKLCDFCKGRSHVSGESLLELELLTGDPQPNPNFKYAEFTTIHVCPSCCKRSLFSTHGIDSSKLSVEDRVKKNLNWLKKQN